MRLIDLYEAVDKAYLGNLTSFLSQTVPDAVIVESDYLYILVHKDGYIHVSLKPFARHIYRQGSLGGTDIRAIAQTMGIARKLQ